MKVAARPTWCARRTWPTVTKGGRPIPVGAALVFDVELLEIVSGPPATVGRGRPTQGP
jgi:hypothetical protein